uniref:NuBaID C-terminal domain-containing protein n=1 Tax=Brassica oleracea TaxID=3712 RepID=A0A3P6GNY3_BRAOL|nr:unnamed protein product [Brassica oleracea]
MITSLLLSPVFLVKATGYGLLLTLEIVIVGLAVLFRINSVKQQRTTVVSFVVEIQVRSNKQMEFDPVKQHRHFCPWIWSTSRKGPGWRQTLSALQRHKGSCQTPLSPSSVLKVDDPLISVRNFMHDFSLRHRRFSAARSLYPDNKNTVHAFVLKQTFDPL